MGPAIKDVLAYAFSARVGFSIGDVGDGFPAPSQGNYRVKATGTSPAEVFVSPRGANAFTHTYRWIVIREFRLDGTLNPGQSVCFAQLSSTIRFLLYWDYNDASSYKVRLYDGGGAATVGISASSYSSDVAEDISIRAQTDGSRIKIWINGVLEIDEAFAFDFANGGIKLINDTLAANQDMYWDNMSGWDSDSEADRCGVDSKNWYLPIAGDGTSDTYGDESTCDSADGIWTKWDDWNGEGTADDGATLNCGYFENAGQEMSVLTNVTITDPANAGLMVRPRGAATAASKTVATWTRIEHEDDIVNDFLEIENSNLTATSYVDFAVGFDAPPDGGADWSQDDFDSLRIGIRTVDTNGASDLWTAIGPEVISIDDDPPALAGVFPFVNPETRLLALVNGGLVGGV